MVSDAARAGGVGIGQEKDAPATDDLKNVGRVASVRATHAGRRLTKV